MISFFVTFIYGTQSHYTMRMRAIYFTLAKVRSIAESVGTVLRNVCEKNRFSYDDKRCTVTMTTGAQARRKTVDHRYNIIP